MTEKSSTGLYIKIAFIVILELLIIITMILPLRDFISYRKEIHSEKEEPVDRTKREATKIYTHQIIDKCHTFSGQPWPDGASKHIPPGSLFFLNPVWQVLKPDNSQMFNLMLYDQVEAGDKLASTYSSYYNENDQRIKLKRLDDGISYVFYNLGENPESQKFNIFVASYEVANVDVLIAPVDLDYIVISNLDPKYFNGGMGAIMENRPTIPVFIPPGQKARETFTAQGFEVKNLIILPEGYSQMSRRLGILVLPIPGRNQDTGTIRECEADMVVKINQGIALIVGEGAPGMENIIQEAEKATGEKVMLYVGGTDFLMGMEDKESIESMKRLAQSHPHMRLYANNTTSILADHHLKRIFGKNYETICLGTSVSLPNPSFLYRCLNR